MSAAVTQCLSDRIYTFSVSVNNSLNTNIVRIRARSGFFNDQFKRVSDLFCQTILNQGATGTISWPVSIQGWTPVLIIEVIDNSDKILRTITNLFFPLPTQFLSVRGDPLKPELIFISSPPSSSIPLRPNIASIPGIPGVRVRAPNILSVTKTNTFVRAGAGTGIIPSTIGKKAIKDENKNNTVTIAISSGNLKIMVS